MYTVLAWVQVDGAWVEGLYWAGDSFTKALWHFQKAKREKAGAYVALRWG